MTSMRKLKRRLVRWRRYANRTSCWLPIPPGHQRALVAVEREEDRRFWETNYGIPPGCTGYIREDLDWGELLTHDRPCPVHGGAR